MPLYDFHCPSCDRRFEELKDRPVRHTRCECGARARRVPARVVVQGPSLRPVPPGPGAPTGCSHCH